MKLIFEKLIAAISNIVVLFGGEAIELDSKYLDTIEAWFESVGITFSEK